jgi:hypothetical protein
MKEAVFSTPCPIPCHPSNPGKWRSFFFPWAISWCDRNNAHLQETILTMRPEVETASKMKKEMEKERRGGN